MTCNNDYTHDIKNHQICTWPSWRRRFGWWSCSSTQAAKSSSSMILLRSNYKCMIELKHWGTKMNDTDISPIKLRKKSCFIFSGCLCRIPRRQVETMAIFAKTYLLTECIFYCSNIYLLSSQCHHHHLSCPLDFCERHHHPMKGTQNQSIII